MSGISISSCAKVDEIRWLILALELEFAFVERSAAAVPCCRQLSPHTPYLLANPRYAWIVYRVLGHDVKYASILVRRGPKSALAQRHVVEQISRLVSDSRRLMTNSYRCSVVCSCWSGFTDHGAVLEDGPACQLRSLEHLTSNHMIRTAAS